MKGRVETLRQKPIPSLHDVLAAKQGYRSWPIENPDISALVPISAYNIAGVSFYSRKDNPPYNSPIPGSIPEIYLRVELVLRLQKVDEALKKEGLELFVHDGWRPACIQYHMSAEWMPAQLRERHPDWNEERIAEEVRQYWAPGPAREEDIDPASPPPHSTGGAVDLTIRSLGGEALWMGTMFDDVCARAHTDSFEGGAGAELSFSDEEARKNRRLLYWLMLDAGFVNNPTEWWHYSYGDQMWAKITSQAAGKETPAFYSNTRPG